MKKEQVAELILASANLLLMLAMCGILIGGFWYYANGLWALAGVGICVFAFAIEWAFQTLYPGS